jgi:leucyl aminopeptidase (aminopeptidase T)
MGDLEQAVDTVLGRCLAVGEGEQLLVVCDPDRTDLGHALLDAGLRRGADAVLTVLPPRPARGTEPPAPIAAALRESDVFVAPSLPSLSHTTARKAASEAGARGATMPGATADLVARLMSADFDAMAARCAAVSELLTAADDAHVTCPRGTDMRFDLRGREGIPDDGDLTAPGAFGNLPCGEGFVSPAGGEGTIVTSSLALIGLVEVPVRIEVRDGRLTDASGTDGARLVEMLTAHGEEGRNLAELGVGTNDRATLTGNVLEDEKLLGTIHVAFGASAGIGGTVSVPVHLDVVVLEPTLDVGGTRVVDAGRFAI